MRNESKAFRRVGQSLERIVEESETLRALKKSDLHVGDRVYVKTLNSVYTIRVIGEDQYLVSGGWFDRNGSSPARTTIVGCTWGGSVIKIDIVAACGLSIEFGNRVVTSTIQEILVIQGGCQN